MAYTTDFTGMDFSNDKRYQPYKVITDYKDAPNPKAFENMSTYKRTSTLIQALNKANKAEVARLKFKQMYGFEPPKYIYNPEMKEAVNDILKKWKGSSK